MVVTASERESDDHKRGLGEAFSQYLGKLRGVHVEKTRSGQKNIKLLREYEFNQDEEAAATQQVAELVEAVMGLITDDCEGAGRKQKYFVVLLGEALAAKQPELTRIPIIMDPEDAPAPTRESELIHGLTLFKDFAANVMKEYLALAKAAPNMVAANAETAAKLGMALATSTVTAHEWEFKKAELEANARIGVAEVNARIVRSDRMWTTFDHFFDELTPFFDMVAAEFGKEGGMGKGGPTDEEIDQVFGTADPDLAALAKKFTAAKGQEADAFREALKARWAGLGDDAKGIVLQEFSKLEKKRVFAIGAWMKRNGLK